MSGIQPVANGLRDGGRALDAGERDARALAYPAGAFFSHEHVNIANLRENIWLIELDQNVEQVYNRSIFSFEDSSPEGAINTRRGLTKSVAKGLSMANKDIIARISPASNSTRYDPPLPDLDQPIPLSALLVSLQAPDGRVIRIFDIFDYVACMERLGYVRVVESEVTA